MTRSTVVFFGFVGFCAFLCLQWLQMSYRHGELRNFVWEQIEFNQSPDRLRRLIVERARDRGMYIQPEDIRFFGDRPSTKIRLKGKRQWRKRIRVSINYHQRGFLFSRQFQFSVFRNLPFHVRV